MQTAAPHLASTVDVAHEKKTVLNGQVSPSISQTKLWAGARLCLPGPWLALAPGFRRRERWAPALEAKAARARRRAKETDMRSIARPHPDAEDAWRDLQPLLDHELNRLPDKYRVPIVLCDLEGKSRKEAARQLGWPDGTLSGRLA